MPSFDIVSEVDKGVLLDAVAQTAKQIASRFDFKGLDVSVTHAVEKDKHIITLSGPEEFHLSQLNDILKLTFTKKAISITALKYLDVNKNLAKAVQKIEVRQGLEQEDAKKINTLLKESKLKVQGSIQGDKVRVTGKDRDDLQKAIALLKGNEKIEVPLQFDNFRE